MANTFQVNDMLMAGLDVFENETKAAKLCKRTLEDGFGNKGAQKGDSCRIRKPVEFTVRDGQAWSGQNIDESYETLTLNYQKGIDFSMSSKERKLDLNSMTDQLIRPAIVRLANEVDRIIIEDITLATAQAVGTPNTSPTAYSTYRDAGVILTNQACPRGNGQRNILLNAEAEGDIVNAGEGFFNRASKISTQYDTAEMDGAFIAGLNWHMDQNVYTHTIGTYAGTPLVNGASQSGSSLITDGWSSGASNLTKGDRFTIANVFSVNPVTKATTSTLQRFTVTAAISDTAGAMTIAISPSIAGPGQAYQNVNALPANDAAITVFGATGVVYSQMPIWNREAVQLAIVPLELPEGVNRAAMKYDSKSGVGLRCIEWYDGDTDLWKTRFDVVFGLVVQRPEWCVAVAGA